MGILKFKKKDVVDAVTRSWRTRRGHDKFLVEIRDMIVNTERGPMQVTYAEKSKLIKKSEPCTTDRALYAKPRQESRKESQKESRTEQKNRKGIEGYEQKRARKYK